MVPAENSIPRVLLVSEKSENIAILIDMLKPLDLEIFVALNAKETFERIESYDFDLILLDIIISEIDGYEISKRLKNNSKHKDIPLIFISAFGGVEDKVKGFTSGVDDYITKPLMQTELIARVKLHLQKSLLFKSLKELLRKSYHELYNPLAIINTSLEMQTLKHGSNRYTDAITVASRTLQIVYDDLYYSLSSRQEQMSVLSIDLALFVQKRIEYFYYLKNSKNITIDFKVHTQNKVQMREADLQRIVDNTLSNAIKYAKESSTVNIDIIDDGENVIFQSKNSGSTIQNRDKIFKKAYREGFEQIGMGIGLEIVASICNTYKIKVDVDSKDGVTSFKYAIPKVMQ